MKSLRLAAVALAVTMSLIPAFAFAQSYPYTSSTGTLLVYVQVTNTVPNAVQRAASDFTVNVVAPMVSQATFTGSLLGTQVTVGGNYSVNAIALSGYTPSYSGNCSGTLTNGMSATCIVTETSTSNYNNYPYSYYPSYYSYNTPYNTYYSAPLTCSPSGQTITIGQSVTFTAQGGDVSQFNWSNSSILNSTSYNIGRTYTTQFLSPGTATISVMNGSQTATCSVQVVGYPISSYGYGYPNNLLTPSTMYPGSTYPAVTVTPTYIPRLPNTGFAPISESGIAFAFALLIAAALVAYPYVRQAFAIVLG